MAADWTTAIAAERMELDREFGDRIDASSLGRQQWGLVMTAVEIEIENPSDPETASLRPDRSSLPAILPELDAVEQAGPGGGAVGGGGAGGRGSGSGDGRAGSGGGLLDAITGALGLGSGVDDERRAEIERLTDQYCERLEEKVRESGRWEAVCRRAAGGGDRPDPADGDDRASPE